MLLRGPSNDLSARVMLSPRLRQNLLFLSRQSAWGIQNMLAREIVSTTGSNGTRLGMPSSASRSHASIIAVRAGGTNAAALIGSVATRARRLESALLIVSPSAWFDPLAGARPYVSPSTRASEDRRGPS